MREEAVVRLADPLRDFSQPSVEPCVAYVSDPLPMAGPDDPVLLSFETSADRSDNPLGVVEPVGGFYALVKGGHCLSPRHCDVHGTIHAIRRHLLQAVNQGVRKSFLLSFLLMKSRSEEGLEVAPATLTALPATFAPSSQPPHAVKDRLAAALMTRAATFTEIPGTSCIKITVRNMPSFA